MAHFIIFIFFAVNGRLLCLKTIVMRVVTVKENQNNELKDAIMAL